MHGAQANCSLRVNLSTAPSELGRLGRDPQPLGPAGPGEDGPWHQPRREQAPGAHIWEALGSAPDMGTWGEALALLPPQASLWAVAASPNPSCIEHQEQRGQKSAGFPPDVEYRP